MATYGITSSGFNAKTLDIIKAETESDFKADFGQDFDISPESPAGSFIASQAERTDLLWQLMEVLYNSQYPNYAEGVSLDLACSLVGVIRKPAEKSVLEGQVLVGDSGTVVPAGQIFSEENNIDKQYETIKDVTLGNGVDEIRTLTYSSAPTTGYYTLTIDSETTANIAYNATEGEIEDIINSLSRIGECTVSISGLVTEITLGKIEIETFTVNNNTNVSISTVHTSTGKYQATVDCLAVEAQYQFVNSLSLNVINNPISGLTRVFNPNSSTEGADIESDADLRLRRRLSLSTGQSTPDAIRNDILSLDIVEDVFVVENDTNLTDLSGRPAKSIEVYVYQLNNQTGDNQIIADALYATKPAGIETYGDIANTVIDSQGRPHDIYFSNPINKPIYLDLVITTNSNFPLNGIETLKENIVTWGELLGAGKDVIVYPQLMLPIMSVEGITDVTVKIGTSANPTTDNNVIIGDGVNSDVEISTWDLARITVTKV